MDNLMFGEVYSQHVLRHMCVIHCDDGSVSDRVAGYTDKT